MAVKNHVAKPLQTFAAKHCEEISYRIIVPKDKFDVDRFSEAVAPFVESGDRRVATLVPRNSKLTDYHVHVHWRPESHEPSKINLLIECHAWPTETDEMPKGLFVENFFSVIGKFFQSENETAHIHAEFEYPSKGWQTRILALPIKVPFQDKMAELNGLSINLPSSPNGIDQAWILRTRKYFTVQMYGDRQIQFKNFAPYSDVDALHLVAKSLIEEKRS